MHKTLAKTVLCGALLAAGSLGQERVSAAPGEAVTLEEAAAFAAKNYPAIRASLAEVAVKSTTERIFVIRVRSGKAEWVNVRRGMTEGNRLEVFGDLEAGDKVVLRATDEIRPGTPVQGY